LLYTTSFLKILKNIGFNYKRYLKTTRLPGVCGKSREKGKDRCVKSVIRKVITSRSMDIVKIA